ncbi:MAG: TIGR02680 family protein [Paraburkholderia sp.]|uniref:TIGR02680 family protein n=1 Tax=Paraburkholderia sp. TaxID=1926495 RepID=UPI0011F7AC75|nr:TIGR02680 family protein [Paraburkholderia sp.]TAM05171.1 MAG: TIGR02680 family protein [Paraburkholderia sp.]TAM32441.1 MAG: TIGR02680 family protein [Paraburkholderia sp.]
MTDTLIDSPQAPRPVLPEPGHERWQPLRIGLVELFHYDSEEFWFRDGHLLLRGNNGTGKSKVLSLTLPFLFDAQLRPSRIEPDGDNGKKMAWNLLMDGYKRRIGYTWIEFGRRQADGMARYLTLGAGLSAVTGKTQVDSWFFLIESSSGEQDPRIGQDLWLTNEQRIVLTRERLRELLEERGRGTVFENGRNYRRAVDERLFHLGEKRYEALMDTLIQLRQPQLSKKPDESGLSHALTEALPPMPQELLADVADALNQLEADREQLDNTRQLEQAVRHFEQRYRTYASTLTRRQARELRQAQTAFDNASEERNNAQNVLHAAKDAEAEAIRTRDAAKQALTVARERLETLQSDPANQDANRLSQAERDVRDRKEEAAKAEEQREEARRQLEREKERSRASNQRAEATRSEVASARTQCASDAQTAGTAVALSRNPLVALPLDELAELPVTQFASAATELRDAANRRRENIRYLEQRHAAVATKRSTLQTLQTAQNDCQAELEEAIERRAEADLDAETTGNALIDAWTKYCAGLEQLRFEPQNALSELAGWTARPDGINPVHSALTTAYSQALEQHAARQTELATRQHDLDQERRVLANELEQLAAGQDAIPPVPATRGSNVREGRAGAPLWQLIDFHSHVTPQQRAGLEASLEACGLLDAWVAPDGNVCDTAGRPIWDTQCRQRPTVAGENLLSLLSPAAPEGCTVDSALIEALLASIACGPEDDLAAESWIAADGRFRLGALTGAWDKREAVYIGHTARAQARQRRMHEIALRLQQLDAEVSIVLQAVEALAADRAKTKEELGGAPTDTSLRQAILAAASAERDVLQARTRLDQADTRCRAAETELYAAREALGNDAIDLQLPLDRAGLAPIDSALDQFTDALHILSQAGREWRSAWPDHLKQQEREIEAQVALERREDDLSTANERREKTLSRYAVLMEAIGAKVGTLRLQLEEATRNATKASTDADDKQAVLIKAAEARAIADTQATTTNRVLAERADIRTLAVERLQRFTESTLLASALPDLPLPPAGVHWTIDPALQLARRAEQALAHIGDDDVSWSRIQRQVSEDLTELQRSLSALGHQAASEPNDWGFTVHVNYQNRSERPDTLAVHLADDIAQRSELLSAREREILENHLQAEIAAEIQRLMRAADKQVNAINDELYKRPTTTGVRYRLQWQPLAPEEGGPLGLEIARERLLNTSSDLWSAEDRRVVGIMLQQQISMERARAEDDATASGFSLNDQLARALDYRRWHRFLVQRQRDKNSSWQKLSGPASSGERALGLTVPLFAAIASFYGRGGNPHAPRLMLLDEAFAGIDDAARAHCMGLIREFDLDFVITSEREWACYAELPGVSICQLQRREGMDAVFVSRWTWDGRAKRRESDPDRRFPDT